MANGGGTNSGSLNLPVGQIKGATKKGPQRPKPPRGSSPPPKGGARR